MINLLLYFCVCDYLTLLFLNFVLMLLGSVTKLIVRDYTSIIDKVIWFQTIFFEISPIKNVIILVWECRIDNVLTVGVYEV